jgi:outer membrane protein OmpA-like peptidoglycan-associated protein
MTASECARRTDVADDADGAGGSAAQPSSSPRYALAALLLFVGIGDLAAIDLVLLPRYLAGAKGALLPSPPNPPASAPLAAQTLPASPPTTVPTAESPALQPPASPSSAPAEPPASAPGDLADTDFPSLLFARNTCWLSPAAREILVKLAAALAENPSRRVVLGGHTDSVGSEDHNRALSIERARRCGRWLEGRGIDAARIETHGFGSTRPAAGDDSPQAQARNRRVEIDLR